MSAHNEQAEKVTVRTLRQMKERGEKIASMTAYDAAFANALERAGIDFVLVGDSLGMVVQGFDDGRDMRRIRGNGPDDQREA